MWAIVLIIVAIVSLFSLSGLIQQNVPELAKYLPKPSISAPAETSPFRWVGHESVEADGTRTLLLSVADSQQNAQAPSLNVGCYKTHAFVYIYPVTPARLKSIQFNGRTISYSLDGAPDKARMLLTSPSPEALIKELPQISRLEVGMTYTQPGGAASMQITRMSFDTAGIGVYMPYFVKDCDQAEP